MSAVATQNAADRIADAVIIAEQVRMNYGEHEC